MCQYDGRSEWLVLSKLLSSGWMDGWIWKWAGGWVVDLAARRMTLVVVYFQLRAPVVRLFGKVGW